MNKAANPGLQALLTQAIQNHQRIFECLPVWGASAPGRVNLIGDHTDYNGGFAMPFAIDRHTIALASERAGGDSGEFRVYSSSSEEIVGITPGPPGDSRPQWHDYARGVIAELAAAGSRCPGVDISIHSDVPVGGGLSSSAALELAIATLIETVAGHSLGKLQKIRLCQSAEQRYAQVPCGILDQFCVTMAQQGRLLLLDCEAEEARSIAIAETGPSFLLIDSAVRHQLNDGAYAERREQCELAAQHLGSSLRLASPSRIEQITDPVLRQRARHVVSENARVQEMADAIARRQWQQAGQLMNSSHESLRRDFEVSCPEVDKLVNLSQRMPAVFGARMTGGGFGGCVIALVERELAEETAQRIVEQYMSLTGLATRAMMVQPVAGAKRIELEGQA